jgi:hypothetical protein
MVLGLCKYLTFSYDHITNTAVKGAGFRKALYNKRESVSRFQKKRKKGGNDNNK